MREGTPKYSFLLLNKLLFSTYNIPDSILRVFFSHNSFNCILTIVLFTDRESRFKKNKELFQRHMAYKSELRFETRRGFCGFQKFVIVRQ